MVSKKFLSLILSCILACGVFTALADEELAAGFLVPYPDHYETLEVDPYAVMTDPPVDYQAPEPANAGSGSVMVSASSEATMNLSEKMIWFSYTHGWDSTHKLVLQLLYTDTNGREHLLGQSGILEIGAHLDRMDALELLPVGDYDCQLGLYFFTGTTSYAAMSTRVAITLHVNEEEFLQETQSE